MSGVFRKIDPHPLTAWRVCTPSPQAFSAGGGHTRWLERGWGVNSSEDARHYSVLYICKYFVDLGQQPIFSLQYTQPYNVFLLSSYGHILTFAPMREIYLQLK
jgi:hypothetical protein